MSKEQRVQYPTKDQNNLPKVDYQAEILQERIKKLRAADRNMDLLRIICESWGKDPSTLKPEQFIQDFAFQQKEALEIRSEMQNEFMGGASTQKPKIKRPRKLKAVTVSSDGIPTSEPEWEKEA